MAAIHTLSISLIALIIVPGYFQYLNFNQNMQQFLTRFVWSPLVVANFLQWFNSLWLAKAGFDANPATFCWISWDDPGNLQMVKNWGTALVAL